MAATSAAGLIDHVQRQLEGIYDLHSSARASAFLVDRKLVEQVGGTVSAREEVFVAEDDSGADLGLYLAPELFERLRGKDPAGPSGLRLVTEELAAFVTLAEGVSHVVYLLRCAEAERPVSLLELEIQAEVDKFAVAALHLWGRGRRAQIAGLWQRLFAEAVLRPNLSTTERERYRAAGRIGGRYTSALCARHVGSGRLDGFLRELRQSYRMTGDEKLRAFAA